MPKEVGDGAWTSYEQVAEYLDDAKNWHEYTFAYFKVLATTEGRITRQALLNRMSEVLGKKVTGSQLVGVQAGINRTIVKKLKKERLDGKDDEAENFWLNEKYGPLVKRYFTST